ncbi:Glycerol-3-phosphate/dihydroxyacetone phosphate acyltransferase [Massospora cicadina]|nr:Glycerol-3-phosphate/dihydroxyacetone phosphate acyltransferase [Massospora cicadina]
MGLEYLLVDLTNGLLSLVVDIFFRDIEARGSHHIPSAGPVFFVGAPHANQFLDPIVLNRHARRRIAYLIAKKSYDRPLIGHLSKLAGAIPVARAQDNATRGVGRLRLAARLTEPARLYGVGTKFTHQIQPGALLSFSGMKVTAEVVEVISDTELVIKAPIGDQLALEALSSPTGVDFTCIPRLDHSVVYQSVYETLNRGGCVGIFPEGGSHDRTQLLPLKAGVAIMSLGAMASNPELEVKIVPCGLSYFHPDRFRSRAVVEYGTPISIPKEMVDQFRLGGEEKRAAGTKLLEIISAALKNITLTAPDYETLKVIQAIRRLYRPPHRKLKISQVVELNRRLIEGYLHFQSDPRIQSLRTRVLEYNQQLETFGIRDHQVKTTKMNRLRATFRLLRRVVFLAILAFLALPGVVLNSPIYITASVVSKRKQKEALANSTVKIAAKDVISSWKILIGLGLGPALYCCYAFLAYLFFPGADAPALSGRSSSSPRCCSLPPLFLVMCGSASIRELQETRERLSNEITALVTELGPQLFPDLETNRMIVSEDANPPLSSGGLSPNTFSALNWFLTPFELVSERLFSDTEGDSSASVSRSSSHPNLPTLDSDASPSLSNLAHKPILATDPRPGDLTEATLRPLELQTESKKIK